MYSFLTPGRPMLAGFGLVLLVEALVSLGGHAGVAGPQPIAFNHAKHVNAGVGCTDCHAGAKTAEHATLPEIAFCLTCHESALTQSAEEAKIRALASAGQPIAWVQVTHIPTHVYFSHRRHTELGGLECATCHGAMEKATVPPVRPFRAMTMDTCIGCHQQNRVRTDCNDCHR